jgi:hypothetical protein
VLGLCADVLAQVSAMHFAGQAAMTFHELGPGHKWHLNNQVHTTEAPLSDGA